MSFETAYNATIERLGYWHSDLDPTGLAADFAQAYQHLYKYEGGWVNDPADRGGETYRGIARKAWPSWIGWNRVDAIKDGRSVTAAVKSEIDGDSTLKSMVKAFFKTNYWDKYGFGKIADQSLAHITWDWTIGTNSLKMASFAWKALGRSGQAPAAKEVVMELAASKDPEKVFNRFKKLRAAHHQNVVEDKPSQAKFLKGWLKRNDSFVYEGSGRTERPGFWGVALPAAGFLTLGFIGYKDHNAYQAWTRNKRKAKFKLKAA